MSRAHRYPEPSDRFPVQSCEDFLATRPESGGLQSALWRLRRKRRRAALPTAWLSHTDHLAAPDGPHLLADIPAAAVAKDNRDRRLRSSSRSPSCARPPHELLRLCYKSWKDYD